MKFLRHRTVAFLLALTVAWGGWEAFLSLSSPRRLEPGLAGALARERLLNVVVTLGFAPEEFHIRLFQTYGVVSGVKGPSILLNRVPVEDVARIARYYWVRRIALQ